MSKMTDYLIEKIEKLSEITGYGFDFLMGVWAECCEDGADWNFFAGVTLELDW